MADKYRVFVSAGEASGDTHGAKLVKALREAAPTAEFEFFGAGGPKLREAGLNAVVRTDDMAIVGLPEIARALPMFIRAFRDLKRAASRNSADAAILIDYPDFNLRLAKALKREGIKIVYYISPQLWAWRKHRLRTVRKYVDLVITILPFEKKWYADHGFETVEYVGSPLVREVQARSTKEQFCAKHGLDPNRPIVAFLPGSRRKELERILPEMFRAAERILSEKGETQLIVALSPLRQVEEVDSILNALDGDVYEKLRSRLLVLRDETYEALNASDAAAITSGTATLEAGIIGTPMAIVYKTSAINYKVLRPMIDVDHFGLINLIAGERVAKELIQNDLKPATLADELLRLLDPAENARERERLKAATDKLCHGGASKRAAEAIMRIIG